MNFSIATKSYEMRLYTVAVIPRFHPRNLTSMIHRILIHSLAPEPCMLDGHDLTNTSKCLKRLIATHYMNAYTLPIDDVRYLPSAHSDGLSSMLDEALRPR